MLFSLFICAFDTDTDNGGDDRRDSGNHGTDYIDHDSFLSEKEFTVRR